MARRMTTRFDKPKGRPPKTPASLYALEVAVLHATGDYILAWNNRQHLGNGPELTRARRLRQRAKQRLAEAKAQPPVDPETLALIDAAIALLPDEFGLGGHPGARCRVSRTERACVTRHADGTTSVTLWIERYLGVQGWEPFVWSTPENLIGDLRAWEQQPICDEEL